MTMKRIRIGCSPLTNTIFAGKLLKDGRTWAANKEDVTIDALISVAHHAINFGKPVEISRADGSGVEYRITVEHFPHNKD